jgi:hypothetical protein
MQHRHTSRNLTLLVGFFTSFTLLLSCVKKDVHDTGDYPEGREGVNQWIEDSMRRYYLWSDAIAASPDRNQNPEDFFISILDKRDKFSSFSDGSPGEQTLRSLFGFDFIVSEVGSSSSQIISSVKLVVSGSPADLAGLKRGIYISRINGVLINSSNYSQLVKDIIDSRVAKLRLASVSATGVVTELQELTVPGRLVSENPVYTTRVFSSGTVKTGYIYYGSFSDEYSFFLKQKFEEFKREGVQELVVDLRYNQGGSLAASAVLAVLVSSGMSRQSVYQNLKGNQGLGIRPLTFEEAIKLQREGIVIDYDLARTASLGLDRVFVLTGNQTASASEAFINGLAPYCRVITIGERTFGKDKGSILIKDGRTPSVTQIELSPVTYELFNARNEGNYVSGIPPKYAEDELRRMPLVSFGSKDDPLLARAIQLFPDPNAEAVPPSGGKMQSRRIFDSQPLPANAGVQLEVVH